MCSHCIKTLTISTLENVNVSCHTSLYRGTQASLTRQIQMYHKWLMGGQGRKAKQNALASSISNNNELCSSALSLRSRGQVYRLLWAPQKNRRPNSCYLPILEKSFKDGHMHVIRNLKLGMALGNQQHAELPGRPLLTLQPCAGRAQASRIFVSHSEN